MPLAATTLILPCYKVELRPVAAHATLRTLIENTCQGLSITPEQLQQELETSGDLPDLVLGELRPAAWAELILQRWTTKEAEIAEAAQLLGRKVHATFMLAYH
jgi:cytochrome P450